MLARGRLIAAVVLPFAISQLVAPPGARAARLTTHYYTISIADPPPSSSLPSPQTRFLGAINQYKGTPLELRVYQPGFVPQHWTPVYPKWPNRDLTGSSPILEGIAEFFDHPFSFSDELPRPPPMKFVNRFSARCITVGPVQIRPGQTFQDAIVQDRCAEGGDLMARQTWRLEAHNPALPVDRQGKFTQSRANRIRCLSVSNHPAASNLPFLTATACPVRAPWYQSFSMLRVATVTCDEVRSRDGYCGLPSPSVVPRS